MLTCSTIQTQAIAICGAKAPPLSISCYIASRMWPILAVCGWVTGWLLWWLPSNLYYFMCNFRTKVAFSSKWVSHTKWQRLSTMLVCIFELDDKFLCTWIDISHSICTTGCHEANLACGGVAVKAIVHGVTTIWSSAQRIGDQVCATRLTISCSWFCKGIKLE